MQFKNRSVSRCSSNPSTHHEFLFIIRLCLDHKKDEAATSVCMHVLLIGAVPLEDLLQKTQFWRHSHNNMNRQPLGQAVLLTYPDLHHLRFTNTTETPDVQLRPIRTRFQVYNLYYFRFTVWFLFTSPQVDIISHPTWEMWTPGFERFAKGRWIYWLCH